MHLEHIFCQVEPYCSNVHIGRLFFFVGGKKPTLALLMPFRKGATIPLKRYAFMACIAYHLTFPSKRMVKA
jgi:hypothetical protein